MPQINEVNLRAGHAAAHAERFLISEEIIRQPDCFPPERHNKMHSMNLEDKDHLLRVMAGRAATLTRLSDEAGVYRVFNEGWSRFTGHTAEDDENNGWLQFVHVDDRAAVMAAHRQATVAQSDVEIQFRLLRRDGTYRWMLDRMSPWLEADGSFGGLVSACTDITSLKETCSATGLDRRAVRFPSVLARLDQAQKFEFASAGVDTLFCETAANILGKTIAEANLPDTVRQVLDQLVRQNLKEIPDDAGSVGTISQEIEFTLHTSARVHHLAAGAIADAEGKLSIFIHDITASVEAQNLQRESLLREELARQKADAAARSRDQFLSVVSHELRSPLNGIQSWAYVLESQVDTTQPVVQRALAGIKTGVTQQVKLIDALLDATQILNGHISLLSEPYSLKAAVQSALDSMRGDAAQKNIDISFTTQLSDVGMIGDTERVQQVVRHLLSNAIKFSNDSAYVQIDISREDDDAVVTVTDNGSGMAPDLISSVFEAFRQVDASSTRREAGLGLGLAVSRRIAEMHGGSLQCESEGVGHGSTFRLVLPLPQ
jgi:PAS domain S-box-containing protein